MYLSPHGDFDEERDHPSTLAWEEEGLSLDWAEGNTRELRLNVSRAAIMEGQGQQQGGKGNGSVRRRVGGRSSTDGSMDGLVCRRLTD